jgi:hypothetical protein
VNCLPLIQNINDVLLEVLVKLVIHSIYSNSLIEDLIEFISNLWNWISDDCEAALLTVNVFISNLAILASKVNIEMFFSVLTQLESDFYASSIPKDACGGVAPSTLRFSLGQKEPTFYFPSSLFLSHCPYFILPCNFSSFCYQLDVKFF